MARQYLSGHAATVNATIRKAQAAGQTVYAETFRGKRTVSGVYRVKNAPQCMLAKWTTTDSNGQTRYMDYFDCVSTVWVEV